MNLDEFIKEKKQDLTDYLISELGQYKIPRLDKAFDGNRSDSLATLRFMAVNSSLYKGILKKIDSEFEKTFGELAEKSKAKASLNLALLEEALQLKVDSRKARGKTLSFDKIKAWPNLDIKDQILDSIHSTLETAAFDYVLASRCSYGEANALAYRFGMSYDSTDLQKLDRLLESSELRDQVKESLLKEAKGLGFYEKSDKRRRFSGSSISKLNEPTRYPYLSPQGDVEPELSPDQASQLDHEKGSEPAQSRAITSEVTKNGDQIPTVEFSASSEEISNSGRVMGNRWIFKVDDDPRSDYEIAYEQTSKAIERSWDRYLRGNGTSKFVRVSQDVTEKLDLLSGSGILNLVSELNDPKASRIISEIEQGYGSSSDLSYLNKYQSKEYLGTRFQILPRKLERLKNLPDMLEEFKNSAASLNASKSRLVDDASERDKQAREPLSEGYVKTDKFSQYAEAYGEMWGTICDLSKSLGDGEYSDGFKKAVAEFIVNAQVTIDETRDKIKTRAMGKPMTVGDKNLVFETMGLNQISRMALGFTDEKTLKQVIADHPGISITTENQIANMTKYSIDKVTASPLFIKASKHAPHAEMSEIDRKIDAHRKSLSKKITYSEFLISGATIDKDLNQLISKEGPYAELACLYATYSISFKQDLYGKARKENKDLRNLYELSNKYPHSAKIFKDILSEDISQKMTSEYRQSKGLELGR